MSKAARKRAKRRNMISLAGGETSPSPRTQGQRPPRQAPDAQTLKTRARQNGIDDPKDARLPWLGCVAGKAMASQVKQHDRRLPMWDAIQHIRATVTAFDRAMGAPCRHARVAQILAPVSAMSADASSPPLDDRTDEQRQDQAEAAIERLYAALHGVDDDTAALCLSVVADDAPCYDVPALIRALDCVVAMMSGAMS